MVSDAIKGREESIIKKHSMEITVNPRIADALNKSSMLSSIISFIYFTIAQRGRSHLLLRDQEEEKTVKGLKKIADNHKQRYNEIWEENDYLKGEIEKLGDELERRRNEMLDEDKNRELLSELYEKGVIDEDGNIIQHNKD